MFLSRRTFLQSVAAALASFFLPRGLRAGENSRSFWLLNAASGDSWPVNDPVTWALANARQPILERASAGLLKLTPADDQRIIRLVVRRCKLNLIEIFPGHVVVHHWSKQGQGDLRPFFKTHGLARSTVRVTLIDRKKEASTHQHGDDFLYGERLPVFWPLNAFWKKWQRRWIEERNDWTAAPGTHSGFGWKGSEPHGIPWVALKSAWRRTTPMLCPNCDQPTILVNFGLPQCGFCNREARFVHACRRCHRLLQDHSIDRFDVERWMASNLDAETLPDFIVWMGKPVPWQPPVVS